MAFWLPHRPAQYIEVESEGSHTLIHYDYLILCMGTQYQVPKIGVAAKNKPKNVFTVNNNYEATYLLHWVQNRFLNNPKGT